MIYIENKKKSIEKLRDKYPGALIVDVTSKAKDGLVKLSPFYPHGDIPVPFSPGVFAVSVEGVWQGLKVFQNADVDASSFKNGTMKNIKRTVRKLGPPLGHRCGVGGKDLLSYLEARVKIFLPTYQWVLENKVKHIIERMRSAAQSTDLVLLDFTTNGDVLDMCKPLSHAALVKAYIEGSYPTEAILEQMNDVCMVSVQDKPKVRNSKGPGVRTSQSKKKRAVKPKVVPTAKPEQFELF